MSRNRHSIMLVSEVNAVMYLAHKPQALTQDTWLLQLLHACLCWPWATALPYVNTLVQLSFMDMSSLPWSCLQ